MLSDLLHKSREIDSWPISTATVAETEQLSEGGRGGKVMRITFTFPAGGDIQSGKFTVDDNSSLYGLTNGEQFDLQFNPRRPSEFYCREAKSLSQTIRKAIIFFGVIFAVCVLLIELLGR